MTIQWYLRVIPHSYSMLSHCDFSSVLQFELRCFPIKYNSALKLPEHQEAGATLRNPWMRFALHCTVPLLGRTYAGHMTCAMESLTLQQQDDNPTAMGPAKRSLHKRNDIEFDHRSVELRGQRATFRVGSLLSTM